MYPNTLKFLIKWFEQGGCKVDAANAYKNAPTDYIIPFLSRQDRDQAWARAEYLMEQDSSVTIQPWEQEVGGRLTSATFNITTFSRPSLQHKNICISSEHQG